MYHYIKYSQYFGRPIVLQPQNRRRIEKIIIKLDGNQL